jgi:hypothetical protein
VEGTLKVIFRTEIKNGKFAKNDFTLPLKGWYFIGL